LSSADAEEVVTERTALVQLIAWAKDRPKWQQDALRRLLLNDDLNEADINDLAKICLDPRLPTEPVTEAHVGAEGVVGEPIALLRIESPTGINALAPDQTLEFATHGLTIIYGDNGSGKSGYVRVLKHACRTRDRGTKILRDVEDSASTSQTARIMFVRGSTEVEFAWTPDTPGNLDLPSVSIFDARSANIHVEKTNAVAYIPQPMRILEGLAKACDQVKTKLEDKLTALRTQTPIALAVPKLSRQTSAGAFLHNLSSRSDLSQLSFLAKLSDEERSRLATLEADLAQDPKRAAARVSAQTQRLADHLTVLKRLTNATLSSAFAERDRKRMELDEKAEASKLASEELFSASPLPEVGQAVWRTLWEAARKYSDAAAYPSKTFPDAEVDKDLCVLCQQPLTQEAVERRMTFETFVKGTAKAEEEAARKEYERFLSSAAATRISLRQILQLQSLIATEIGDAVLAKKVKDSGIRASWRLRAFLREQPVISTEPQFPAEQLNALLASMTARAAQLAAGENSAAHVALVKEYQELKDRERLVELLEDIKAEIDRRKIRDTIETALKDTAKKSITTKNKEFSDLLVTNALRGRFAREIEKLKLARMPVELRKIKDQNAISYFQVCLVEKPNAAVGEIFSEGEHRGVALAAFLAELVTSHRYSGIVFDDPMSSLDHVHRKAVAGRLVEEAQHRQVIVFTHDLAFLYELRREAEAVNRPVHYQTIRRRSARPGYVEGELPNKAKSAIQLAQSLRSELKEIKGQFDHWPDARRTLFSKGFIEQLREAWDHGIADFIYPVLGRFDNHIKGTSLFKLAVLTEADVAIVTAARRRLSEELHVSSETLNPETVSRDDLLAEIIKLETWLADISQRQKGAKAPVTSFV
jgi:energy-coupling factor transporter ATP-binding protein EcfA2